MKLKHAPEKVTQPVLQGAFILAKAKRDPKIATAGIDHLFCYIELLFNVTGQKGKRS